jgi:uncharacterized protein (TIGR02599 family)
MEPLPMHSMKHSGHVSCTARGRLARWHGGALPARAFTLVELLLSMTILSVLMLVVVNVIGIVQQQWVRSSSRVSAFREARMAFDLMARNLGQATLNTYWANEFDTLGKDAANQDRLKARNYVRQSELQFVSGRTTGLLTGATAGASSYPGHAVFFQAPLGITRLSAAGGAAVNTENMVNLLCPRGYFVTWGSDQAFRPPFLEAVGTVRPRFRYRLMEYSPTAESNRIYYDSQNNSNLANRLPITSPSRSRSWFQDAVTNLATAGETSGTRGATRPIAENIIALVISPQLEDYPGGPAPESIAPLYEYDSALITNPGATASILSTQGTQHLLPPILKISMVALDNAAGERLAEGGNESQQERVAQTLGTLFTSAAQFNDSGSVYRQDLAKLEAFLTQEKLNFRVFSTTVALKQARWSR